jgi:hypothetical protein
MNDRANNSGVNRDQRENRRDSTALSVECRWVLTAIAVGILLGGMGCSTARPATERPHFDASKELTNAPDWVVGGCRSHWEGTAQAGRVICATGSAPPNRNHSRARETAIARARTEIVRSLEVTIESIFAHLDDGSTGGRGQLLDITQQLAMASLPRCSVEAMWTSPNGTLHALVALTQTNFEASMRDAPRIAEPVRQAALEGAAAAFAELDEESENSAAENENWAP